MGQISLHRSSTGHVLSSTDWLELHFEACRPEYELMLDFAGLQAGMRVLDAGCGSGAYLPLLRDRIGPTGRLHAIDSAFEHARSAGRESCVVNAAIAGSVAALPFAQGAYDAVWCANTTQYLTDAELESFIAGASFVVRPGGIVAIKDVDMTGFRFSPAPPLIGLHLADAALHCPAATPQSRGSLRGRGLGAWLQASGLEDVRQQAFLVERSAPLDDAATGFWSGWLPYLAIVAEQAGVPEEDARVWQQVCTPELARDFVERPDFYGCELQVVAVGRVRGGPR
jgi:SAM-dependent methyltransferase